MNIFLVPAPRENVEQTLRKKVDFDTAAEYLTEEAAHELERACGGRLPFHCFAVTDGNNRRNFESMRPGDELLFAVTGVGRFEYRGQIKATFESQELGRKLWPHAGNTGNQRKRGDKPWELIYIVDNLEKIELDKRMVLQAFGYSDSNDVLNGLRRIRDQTTNELIARFQTVTAFLNALRENQVNARLMVGTSEVRRSAPAKLTRRSSPAITPIDVLRSVAQSGTYRLPPLREIPALVKKMEDLISNGGITVYEAAAHVLAPFYKLPT